MHLSAFARRAPHGAARLALALFLIGSSPRSGLAAQTRGTADSASIAPGVRVGAQATGASRGVIDSSDVRRAAALTFSELLQARAASVDVMMSGGRLVDGGHVRVRGPSTVATDGVPLLIVDGMRMAEQQDDGGSTASRLDDVAIDDVATMEVLRGPSAAAMYGAGASAGAIVVTTKRGEPGRLRGRVRAMVETRRDAGNWSDRYRRRPVGSTSSYSCSLANEAGRFCTPGAVERWNPLEESDVFRTGFGGLASLDLAGGMRSSVGRLSATLRRASGITRGDGLSSIATRLNATHRIGSLLEISGRVSYFGNNTEGSIVGEVIEGVPYVAIGRSPVDSFSRWSEFKLGSAPIDGRLDHLTVGGDLVLRPASWLAIRAGASRDRVDGGAARAIRFPPFGSQDPNSIYIIGPPSDLIIRSSSRNTHESMRGTAELSVPLPSASGKALVVLGAERERRDRHQEGAQGWEDGGGINVSLTHRYTNDALLAVARLGLAERLTIGGGVRREKDTGADRRWSHYPSADVALAIPALLRGRGRLRAAYGESAQRYSMSGGAIIADPIPEIYYGSPNFYQRPLPERMKELEGGIDLDWADAGAIAVTAYQRSVTNVAFPTPTPFQGAVIRTFDMKSHGVELDARVGVLRRGGVRWGLRGIVATNANRITTDSAQLAGVSSTLHSGAPLGVTSRRTTEITDTNGNGIVEFNEVVFGNDFERSHGSMPTLTLALHSELRLGRNVSLNAVLDRRSGAWTQSGYLFTQCKPPELSCAELQDPATPFAEQARAWRDSYLAFTAPKYDASFTRLREVSLRWSLDRAHAQIVLSGRDLLMWTDWRGPDPEISALERGAVTRDDAGAVPLPRRLMLGVEMDY